LGNYLLHKRIAVGGMAELYLAQDVRDGDSVCVKRILPYLAAENEFSNMFLDEARIASTLQHPNIVAVRDLGNTGDNIFIVMEFVDGLDLRRVAQEEQKKKQQTPYALAAWIVARVAEGLGYAHDICWPRGHARAGKRIGLIHRDVSPQNVMLSYDGDVKLVDFGIAKASEEMDKTKPGIIKGKFLYLAPEQVTGEKLDHRADLFALGTLLYEVTTGKSPFQRATAEGVIVAIRSEEPEDPKKIRRDFPAELTRIIRKCLQKDRAKRYQSGGEVAEDLDAWLQTQDETGAPELAEYLDKLLGGTKARRVSLPPPPPVPVRPQQPSGRPGDQTVDHPPARAPARRPAAPPRSPPAPARPPPPVASLGDDDEPEATQMMAAFSGDTLETGDHEPYETTAPERPKAFAEQRPKVVQGPWGGGAPSRPPVPASPAPRRPTRAGAIQLNPGEDSLSEITAQDNEDEFERTDDDQTAPRGGRRPAPGQGLKRAQPQRSRSKGLVVALVGLLVLLVAAAGVAWWMMQQSRQEAAAAQEAALAEVPQPLPEAAAPAEPEKAPEPPPPPPPPPLPAPKVGLRFVGPKGAQARLVAEGKDPTSVPLGDAVELPPGKVDYEFRCKGKGNWKVATVGLAEPGPVQVKLSCPK